MLEEKCRQLEQHLDLQTKQPSNGVLGNSSELSQLEENITTIQSVQESFHQDLASKMSSWKVSRTISNWLRSTKAQSSYSHSNWKVISCMDNEALLTEKEQPDRQLRMVQSKQSNQKTIHNERQLVDLQEKFEVLQVKTKHWTRSRKTSLSSWLSTIVK